MKRALIPIVGLALIAAACSSDDEGATTTSMAASTTLAAATTTVTPAPTTVAPTTTSTTVPVTTSTTTTPPTTAPGVLLSVEAMWAGQNQTIVLYSDGVLEAGSAQGQANLTGASDYWMDEQARITVVDLGASEYSQAILVELPVSEDEDPPNVNQLFVVEGKALRRVLNEDYGVYGVTTLRFAGDGTIEYQEDGWTACAREDYPVESNRQIVTLGFVGDHIGEIGRRDSSEVQVCDRLAG